MVLLCVNRGIVRGQPPRRPGYAVSAFSRLALGFLPHTRGTHTSGNPVIDEKGIRRVSYPSVHSCSQSLADVTKSLAPARNSRQTVNTEKLRLPGAGVLAGELALQKL